MTLVVNQIPTLFNARIHRTQLSYLKELRRIIQVKNAKSSQGKLGKIIRTRYGRKVRPAEIFKSFPLSFLATETMLSNDYTEVSQTAQEAMKDEFKDLWCAAMLEELKSMLKNKVFSICKKPHNRKIIRNKWVFASKTNSENLKARLKARLIAKGYSQIKGVDFESVFSPVTKFESLRYLLAFANQFNLKIRQYDIKQRSLTPYLKNLSSWLYLKFQMNLSCSIGTKRMSFRILKWNLWINCLPLKVETHA